MPPGSGRLGANEGKPPVQAGPPQQPCCCWWMGPLAAFAASMPSPRAVRGLAHQEGVPTSAPYCFLKAVLDNVKGPHPQGWVIAFDTAEPTPATEGRRRAYKAAPRWGPSQLLQRSGNCRRILSGAMDLPCGMANRVSRPNDVLGQPRGNRAANAGWRVRILSGVMRTLFQLVR